MTLSVEKGNHKRHKLNFTSLWKNNSMSYHHNHLHQLCIFFLRSCFLIFSYYYYYFASHSDSLLFHNKIFYIRNVCTHSNCVKLNFYMKFCRNFFRFLLFVRLVLAWNLVLWIKFTCRCFSILYCFLIFSFIFFLFCCSNVHVWAIMNRTKSKSENERTSEWDELGDDCWVNQE